MKPRAWWGAPGEPLSFFDGTPGHDTSAPPERDDLQLLLICRDAWHSRDVLGWILHPVETPSACAILTSLNRVRHIREYHHAFVLSLWLTMLKFSVSREKFLIGLAEIALPRPVYVPARHGSINPTVPCTATSKMLTILPCDGALAFDVNRDLVGSLRTSFSSYERYLTLLLSVCYSSLCSS